MPIDITFKKYKKGGLLEVYGNVADAIKKISSLLASNGKEGKGIYAYRFMLDTSKGPREILVWKGPGYSVVAHNCKIPPKDIEVYKIYYEVFDVDSEGLEYDLTKLKINNICHRKSEKPPEALIRSVIGGGIEEETPIKKPQNILEGSKAKATLEASREEFERVNDRASNRGAMDVCLIALNRSVEKLCPVSSREVLESLDSCGVYFNMDGGSYLCILEEFDGCKYLVSRIDGSFSRVDCLPSRKELLRTLGWDSQTEHNGASEKRARPPLQA